MMLQLCRNIARVSSRKFYEIANEDKEEKIPKAKQEIIISKFLKNKNKLIDNDQKQKTPQKLNYHGYLSESPEGSILKKSYKNTEICLVSLNYLKLELQKIHQLCKEYQPDLIFVQSKPDNYLPNFQILPKKNEVFSDKKYLEEIQMGTSSIKKNLLFEKNIQKKLKSIANRQDQSNEKVFIEQKNNIVDDSILYMLAYYSATNSKPLILGQMPSQPYRQWIINSHTLMQLQELFKNICKRHPMYDKFNMTPYQLGSLMFPDIFLKLNDKYMATVLQMIVSKQKHKNIICFTGLMQNSAIDSIQQNKFHMKEQNFIPVLEYLIAPQIKSSIIKNIEGWQIIQKHILFDVLFYGQQILQTSFKKFTNTNRIIRHYGQNIYSYPKINLERFRFDMIMKYISIMREKIQEGKQLKKKVLLREAIRSKII